MARSTRVYCGNNTSWSSIFEEPEECGYEGEIELPEDPADDKYWTWLCPDCSMVNMVRDHEVATDHDKPVDDGWRGTLLEASVECLHCHTRVAGNTPVALASIKRRHRLTCPPVMTPAEAIQADLQVDEVAGRRVLREDSWPFYKGPGSNI